MKLRVKLAILVGLLVAGPVSPALAHHGGPWACAALDTVDLGVCVYDPTPPPPRDEVRTIEQTVDAVLPDA